ncbi:MBL fold metallo-hydrolase [Natronospora cellulosivora (SeqCode)]
MKLIVLGSRAAFPSKNEACSGYLLQDDSYNLLIDCGSGVVSALQNYIELDELDAVILSHYHADHWSDISVLQHGIMVKSIISQKNKSLKIYGHQEDESFKKLNYKSYTIASPYQENSTLELGPFTINFIKTKHPTPCYAMKIKYKDKKIIYTADTSYFPELSDFALNSDLLIAECSLYPDRDGQKMGHMNSSDVGKLARESTSKTLLLCHLPNYGDNKMLLDNTREYYQGKIKMASRGWEYEL